MGYKRLQGGGDVDKKFNIRGVVSSSQIPLELLRIQIHENKWAYKLCSFVLFHD